MGLADDILHVPVCQCTAYLSVFVCNYVPARQRTGFLCAFVAAHCCLRVFMCLRGCIYLRACMPTYVHAYMAVSLYCVSMCLRGGVLRAFVAEYLRAYVPVWLGSTCLRARVTAYLCAGVPACLRGCLIVLRVYVPVWRGTACPRG